VLLGDVTDVDGYGVGIVHVPTVEELPIAVLLMNHEQNRSFVAVDCTREISGLWQFVSHY
jgi:hypothetical protein